MSLIGSGLISGGSNPGGNTNQVQRNIAGNFFADNKHTFDGSTLKIVRAEDDDTNIICLENTGANPGQSGLKISDRPPIGNVEGKAGDLFIHAASALSALYMHKNSVSNDTDWFEASLNPSSIKNVSTAAEFDALGTAGVISITTSKTIVIKGTFTTGTRIVVSPGVSLSINGNGFADGGVTYSGTGTFITADGALIIRISGLNALSSSSSGQLYDIKNSIVGFFILQSQVTGWAIPGVFENVPNVVFREIGVFNSGGTTTFKNCSSVIFTATFINAVTTSEPIITITGNLKNTVVRIESTNTTLNTDESLIQLSKDLPLGTRVTVQNTNLFGENKNLFTPNAGSPQDIELVAVDNVSGTITKFETNGSGGTKVTPSSMTGLNADQTVIIDTTTSYNGGFFMFNITGTTFDISAPFVNDDATGNFNADSIIVTITAHGFSDGDYVEAEESNSYNGFYKVFSKTDDTFNISTDFIDDQEGTIDEAFSFDKTDPRVLANLNSDLAASANKAYWIFNNNTDSTSITDETYLPLAMTGLVAGINSERWKVVNNVTGRVRYIGFEPLENADLISTLHSSLVTSNADYRLSIKKNNDTPVFATSEYWTLSLKLAGDHVTIISPISAKFGDEFEINIAGEGTSQDLVMREGSFRIRQ